MIDEENTFYLLKHPDHLGRFFRWFSNQPSKPRFPNKIKFDLKNFISVFISNVFLGLLLMMFFLGFSKTAIIIALIPAFLFLFIFLFNCLRGLWNYFEDKHSYQKELKNFPQRQSAWIRRLPEYYIKYCKYITTKVKYRFNPETQIGNTSSLLKSSLNKLNIDVKQEAELLWKGLNLLPQKPKWRRRIKDDGWFKQFKYTADFIYVDSEKGIMLDIEIDEKYHFENISQLEKDKRRNNIFLCSGWSIIRFKDNQVRKNPRKCAEDIKKIISQIESMHSTLYMQLKQFHNTGLININYPNDYYLDCIRAKTKEIKKEYFENIDYACDFEVDYSSYQLGEYIREYYSI